MKNPDNKKITLSDPEIIDLYFERDESAIEATDTKYGNYLFTIGFNILNDKWDSEECINDTFFALGTEFHPKSRIFCRHFYQRS